ncbi:MAG: HD domain-containing protein, partial [Gammaproteobacteria bacterium]|nr:HD domain-containing protein [Gammaproteobacteria bacterium]
DKETCNKSFEFGANDFLTKPFNFEETKHRIINLIEMHLLRSRLENKNRMLEDIVAERTRALKESQTQIIQHLGMAAEYKDMETAAHTVRVGWYSRIIGERWGMDAEALELLFLTAPMHDIGKIGIPDNVLLKPDKFEPEEWEIMKSHTTIGEKILQGNSNPLVETAKTIALTHHEKWDGTGYPSGLSGNDIPIEGRIVMIADVFDALTITRPYKKAWTTDEAVAHIVEGSGSSFDPDLVVIFQEALADLLEIKERYKD